MMYSVVLMMAMTTSTPGELFPNRPHLFGSRATGCAGTAAVPPRETFLAAAPVRGVLVRIGERLHERPRLFVASAPRSSYGCAGTTIAVQAGGCAGRAALVAPVVRAGCSGGAGLVSGTAVAGPQPATMEAGRLVTRIAVHRQLRIALGRSYGQAQLNDDQREAVRQALSDENVYEAVVSKVTHDLNKQLAAKETAKPGSVGALGDGHLLQLLISSLPQIIAAIQEILKLFPHAFALPPVHEWQPMPRGPWAPPRVVLADYRLAC